MVKLLVVLSVLFSFELSTSAQQDQTSSNAPAPAEYKVPPEAARQTNPVKPTPETTGRAKKLYGYDCAMCHGKNGDGKGDMASDMKSPMLDFTDPAALKNLTDGELFYMIKNGRGEMPPEGDRAKVGETWSLVTYVRSFAKKPATGTTTAAQ
jgi:mono/diheme cytochrome c family protein